VRWETPVPKSFEWETEPAAEGDDYVTVDHFGTVTSVDVHTGEIRWQHSDDWALLDTRVLLTGRSVAFHDFAGHVVVLDRATGAVRSAARPGGAVIDAAVRGDLLVSVVSRDVASRFEARPVPSGAAGGHRYNGCRPDPPDGAPPRRHPGSRTPASSEVVPRTRGAGGRRTQPEERKPHPWLKPWSP
jgi:hypothetical protein